VFRGHAAGFRSQPIPESVIGVDRHAGIEALLKKSIELFLRSVEAGGGSGLHNGKGGVESFLGGMIRSRINYRLDSLFLFGSQLYGHDWIPYRRRSGSSLHRTEQAQNVNKYRRPHFFLPRAIVCLAAAYPSRTGA
jgi:hypothetical protein